MKNITIFTLGAMLVGAAASQAQTTAVTKPSGYVTHTLKAGQFNLIGLTLHEPVIAAGVLEDVVPNDNGTPGASSPEVDDDFSVLTDDQVDFGAVLTAGKTYILEITDAADTSLNGTIQEVTVWDNNTITTPQDLHAEGLRAGDKYQLRAAKTISDIFGATNSAGLKASTNSGGADVVWLSNVGGGFDKIFYSPGGGLGGGNAGWKYVGGGDASNHPVCYTDAVFIRSRSANDKSLVVTGSVKTQSTVLALQTGFNFVSVTFPVGATLGNSGLADNLAPGTNSGSADVVWIPNGNGGYEKYFYSPGGGLGGGSAGWKSVSGAENPENTPLTSGMIIRRRGAATNSKLTPPSSYGDL